MKRRWRQLVWYGFKLPVMLTAIMIGFVLEYLFMMPFMMACLFSGSEPYSRRRHRS
jgi:NhaP-type Na+/H+ or K+/H+ antiporter